MLESALIAKYVPFMALTAAGRPRMDSSSLMTAIATALITGAATVYATVNVLGTKVDSLVTTQAALILKMDSIETALTTLQVDRATRIGRGEAEMAAIKADVAATKAEVARLRSK